MHHLAIIKVAFRALRRNKMRTVLTMLGIIIGVGAVIAMVALGRGAKAQVEARIAALGQNVIQVFSGSVNRSGVFSGFGGAGTVWLLALALPLSVLGNLVRMLFIIFAAEIGGQATGNYVHESSIFSMIPYIPAIAGLLLSGRWLEKKSEEKIK